ncbi:MAG: hypothetical protein HY681_11740 [Chloroflexi bacterium]|nr:hypothetical protein [Chloroflexota bacterium]
MSTQVIAPLGNLQCPDLAVGEWFRVIRTPVHVRNVIDGARQALFIRDPADFPHCLVISRPGDHTYDEARAWIERALLLLRVYKPGNVYYNFALHDDDNWLEDPKESAAQALRGTSVYFFKGWDHPGITSWYQITADEAGGFAGFIEVNWDNEVKENRAFNLFFRGYHEPYADDRFLRNAIALENLLVNDTKEQSNIRYKFVDRGAFLLQMAAPRQDAANGYASDLKDIYDARCQLVHSSNDGPNWTSEKGLSLAQNADSYTRLLLKLVLSRPELGTAIEVDRLKRSGYGGSPSDRSSPPQQADADGDAGEQASSSGRSWRQVLLPFLSAAVGALLGAWYAGQIALDQWRLAKIVDTYDRLIQAADRGQFTASDMVWEFRLARNAAQQERENDSQAHILRALDSKRRVYEESSQFVVPTLVLEGLGLKDESVTSRWRSEYKENVHTISMFGASADSADSTKVAVAQARLDTLRFELIESAKLDIRSHSEAMN